jgi:hypothetical protein
MKQLVTILLAVAAGGALVWYFKGRDTSEAAPSATTTTPVTGKPAAPVATVSTAAPGPSKTLSEADKVAAALQDQVVVTLGKVEDVGRQAGVMLLNQPELAALQALDPATRTPEQSRRLLELERQRASALGALPEIEHFQDNPDEYARFFGSLLTEAGKLDAAQSKAVTEYMRARGTEMIAAGLNAGKEPDDVAQEEVWEEQRDAFNEETVDGVAKLLPPGEAERIGFTDKFIELMEQDFDKAK